MAVMKGNSGAVKVDQLGQPSGSLNIAEVRSWSVEEQLDTLETTTMGTSARTYLPSISGWSGSIDVYWDDSFDAGNNISVGNQIVIDFYPEDTPTGEVYGGTCTVTGVSIASSFDGMVEASITVQGTGALFS